MLVTCTPVTYTPVTCMPMTFIPVRCMPITCKPVRCIPETDHAWRSLHLGCMSCEIYAPIRCRPVMHARGDTPILKIHAPMRWTPLGCTPCENTRSYKIHGCEIHINKKHAREMQLYLMDVPLSRACICRRRSRAQARISQVVSHRRVSHRRASLILGAAYLTYATPELCLPPISCRIVSPDTSRCSIRGLWIC